MLSFARVAPSSTTSVRIRDLRVMAQIGINQDEIGRNQLLVISVVLQLSTTGVQHIGDTIDYRRIADAAAAIANDHVPLIETFAYRLAQKCLTWPLVAEADVQIDKPAALPLGTAGAGVTMRRS